MSVEAALIFWVPWEKGMPGCTILSWNVFGLDYDFYWYTGDNGITYQYEVDSNALQPLLSEVKEESGSLVDQSPALFLSR